MVNKIVATAMAVALVSTGYALGDKKEEKKPETHATVSTTKVEKTEHKVEDKKLEPSTVTSSTSTMKVEEKKPEAPVTASTSASKDHASGGTATASASKDYASGGTATASASAAKPDEKEKKAS